MAYYNGPMIQFFGHLASDPEEFGKSEKPPVGFSVAVNFRRYDTQENGYVEETTFYRCRAFGYNSEQALKLRKGDFVWISGNFQPREYQNRENETRMSFDVGVQDMHAYLSLTRRDNGGNGNRDDDRRDDDRGGNRGGGSNRRDDDRDRDRGRGRNSRDDDRDRAPSGHSVDDVDDLPF